MILHGMDHYCNARMATNHHFSKPLTRLTAPTPQSPSPQKKQKIKKKKEKEKTMIMTATFNLSGQ